MLHVTLSYAEHLDINNTIAFPKVLSQPGNGRSQHCFVTSVAQRSQLYGAVKVPIKSPSHILQVKIVSKLIVNMRDLTSSG